MYIYVYGVYRLISIKEFRNSSKRNEDNGSPATEQGTVENTFRVLSFKRIETLIVEIHLIIMPMSPFSQMIEHMNKLMRRL